jgi:hypothetical protein
MFRFLYQFAVIVAFVNPFIKAISSQEITNLDLTCLITAGFLVLLKELRELIVWLKARG